MARSGRLRDRIGRALHPPGTPFPGVVVAVSGGADSMALARLVLEARAASSAPVILAHLNHQLRGPGSDADEAFLARFHADLRGAGVPGLSLVRDRLDVRALAEGRRENLEAAARDERYRWLTEVASAHGIGLIATGHNADDQAETVLHHLLRGTGLQGLRGIAARRELAPGVELVRPLLGVTRAEITDYLAALGQASRHDASNDDLRLMRNRIRHELLPLLRDHYNPGIAEALSRLAAQAETARAEAEGRAAELLARAERPRASEMLIFDRVCLESADRPLVREVFRLVWAREGWPMGRMGFAAWERVAGVIFGETAAADLPGHVHIRRTERVIRLGRAVPD